MVMGMGFPAYRGGLIFWADLVGAGEKREESTSAPWAGVREQTRRGIRPCLLAPPAPAHPPARTSLPPPPLLPEHIRARLAGWAAQFEGSGLAGFFRPCAYLEDCARRGAKLSAGRAAPSKM